MSEQQNFGNPDDRLRMYEQDADKELHKAAVTVSQNIFMYGFSKGLSRGALVVGAGAAAVGIEKMALEGDVKSGAIITAFSVAQIVMSQVVNRISVPELEKRTQ